MRDANYKIVADMSLYPKNPDNPQMSTVKTDETDFGDFVTMPLGIFPESIGTKP